jgi:hypothetical protein
MSEFTVDQGRAEDLISRYLTAALNDSLEDEEALDLGIDAAASLERAVASGLEDDEADTCPVRGEPDTADRPGRHPGHLR